MKAAAMAGDTYRLEFDLGNAEDAATVLSVTGSATTPAVSGLILEVKPETGAPLELIEIIE